MYKPKDAQTTELMHACRYSCLDKAKDILLGGADPNQRNSEGNTALWLACYAENIEIIQLLEDYGANLNNTNNDGVTALMYASSAGKAKVVRALLDLGADSSIQSNDGFSALDLAASREVLILLRNRP